MYIYTKYPIFHHMTKVRNKTTYEASSFHTSGAPRNVPYTILTRNQHPKSGCTPPMTQV